MAPAEKRVEAKNKNGGYIAYFKSFTSTYSPLARLKELFAPAIMRDVLSVGTRPDCLPEGIVVFLGELDKIKPIRVELGLQTSKPESVSFIRRGCGSDIYADAVKRLHK